MKNLANCKPSEFLMQTNRIKKSVENWLKITDIPNIRKNVPPLKEDQSVAERKRELEAQTRKNLSDILDAIMEKHPQESIELLALICFIEPEHADDYPMSFYLEALSEIISDKAVLGFFTSLTRLGQTDILNV